MKITAALKSQTKAFRTALEDFLARVEEDRNVLAVVLLGSIHETLIWGRHELHLWIIERDGVSKRHRADGNDERIFRTLVENDINLHCELIPRSRFKLMVEGNSRTAFTCNYFEKRQLMYSDDRSITRWFEEANQLATRDQEKELLATVSWLTHARRRVADLVKHRRDPLLAAQNVLWCAHAIACLEVIQSGEIYEDVIIDKAIADQPNLFEPIYLHILNRKPTLRLINKALEPIDRYLSERYSEFMKPLLEFLAKTQRVTPLSEIADHFAYTQLYPWHLESACEWLVREGIVDKHAAPFHLTKRSLTEVEEPAYFLDR